MSEWDPAPPGPGIEPAPGEPESGVPSGLRRARALARLMDSSIPVPLTRRTFGLDAVLGLVPGLGDAAGAAIAAYIVGVGVRLGASRSVLLRMLGNVALEAALGAVPGVGDLFDAAWKANARNVELLERHVMSPDGARRASGALLVTAGVGFLLIIVVTAWISLRVAGWLLGLLPIAGLPASP